MRLLLDESIPVKFRRSLPNHDVRTVVEMGWSGVKNGKLLALAADGFDAFIIPDSIRDPVPHRNWIADQVRNDRHLSSRARPGIHGYTETGWRIGPASDSDQGSAMTLAVMTTAAPNDGDGNAALALVKSWREFRNCV